MPYFQPYSPVSTLSSPFFPTSQKTIEVTGEGMVSVEPDRALITLGVVTENKSVAVSQNENTAIMTRVIDSLLQLGIPKANIKTSEYRIEPQYDYEQGTQTLRGYRTTHLLQVTLDQVALTGQVIDTAVNHGANTVSSVQFTLAHPDFYYNQALSFALKNAEQKAVTISQSLGIARNPIPLEIVETSTPKSPTPLPVTYQAFGAASPIQAGKMQVTATIRVKFSYFS